MSLDLKCNGCGRKAPDAEPLPLFNSNRLGQNLRLPWFRCSICDTYFCGSSATEEDEAEHHKTRQHGRLAQYQLYRELKAPLYKYIAAGLVERGLSSGKLLDFGSSFGGFLDEAKTAGFEASAVDVNPDCVSHLQSKGYPAQQASSLANLPLPKVGFDAITMLDVAYYFKDQKLEFECAKSFLRPGGLLVLRTTNRQWAVKLATAIVRLSPKRAQELFARSVVDHAFVQSAKSLRKLLMDCGFQDITIEADSTHMKQAAPLDARIAYFLGTVVSKLFRRPVLSPGVIVWARSPYFRISLSVVSGQLSVFSF